MRDWIDAYFRLTLTLTREPSAQSRLSRKSRDQVVGFDTMIVHFLGEERVAFLSLVNRLVRLLVFTSVQTVETVIVVVECQPSGSCRVFFFFQPSPFPVQALDSFCHVSRITTATPQL